MSVNTEELHGFDLKTMVDARNEMPSILYQYTDIDAFQGIIEKNEIWATHWRYLNDKNELKYGIKLIEDGIQWCKQRKYSIETKKFLDLFEGKITNVSSYELLKNEDLYIISLSKKKDLLSQWRGYGRKYKSVCIGFSTKKMKVGVPFSNGLEYSASWEDEDNIYKFRKILYDEQQQKGMAITFVKAVCDGIEKEMQKGELKMTHEERVDSFLKKNISGLLCIKEPCWKEEKEWRVIVQPKKTGSLNNIKFRKNEYGLVPYIPINFSETTMMDSIHTVYLPRSDYYLISKKSMEMYWNSMMKKHKCKHGLKIFRSKISIVY